MQQSPSPSWYEWPVWQMSRVSGHCFCFIMMLWPPSSVPRGSSGHGTQTQHQQCSGQDGCGSLSPGGDSPVAIAIVTVTLARAPWAQSWALLPHVQTSKWFALVMFSLYFARPLWRDSGRSQSHFLHRHWLRFISRTLEWTTQFRLGIGRPLF